jgi:hypothetical protein
VPASDDQGIQIPVVWLGPEDVPIMLANAFISQFDPQTFDSLTLTVGQMTPPAIQGLTDEDRRQQIEQIAYVPIKPVVRLGLTPARALELIATLQSNLDQLEHARRVTGIAEDPRES